jgi:hypothetical protein
MLYMYDQLPQTRELTRQTELPLTRESTRQIWENARPTASDTPVN